MNGKETGCAISHPKAHRNHQAERTVTTQASQSISPKKRSLSRRKQIPDSKQRSLPGDGTLRTWKRASAELRRPVLQARIRAFHAKLFCKKKSFIVPTL